MISEESWFLCLECQRAYQRHQNRQGNLTQLDGVEEGKCAYNDCTGLFPEDVVPWGQVLQLQHQYPSEPQTGVVYSLQ